MLRDLGRTLLGQSNSESRLRNRARKSSIEGLEDRNLLSTVLPDVAVLAATTTDSNSVTVTYDINNAPLTQPLQFGVYRGTTNQYQSSDVTVGTVSVVPAGQPNATLDQAGQSATAIGHHVVTLAIPGGLPINPQNPYVVVVADPSNAISETNKANNSAAFQKHVIGVIVHGGLQSKKWATYGPLWEVRMAQELKAEGYDSVIAYNWVRDSNHAGSASFQAPYVAADVLQAASKLPAGDPVDVHFIGHSEGAVINSMATIKLNELGWTPELRAGFLQMTMLDPHAANNAIKAQQYSVSNGVLGWIARQEINSYQSKAQDPPVIVPSNVQEADVFFQHTPVSQTRGSNNGIYNLWGQVPIHGNANYFDLTAPGISHAGAFGVQDWYRLNVVPSLGNGAPFVRTDTLSISADTLPSDARLPANFATRINPPTYSGTAAPGAIVRLLVRRSNANHLTRVGHTTTAADGTWQITTRPLTLGRYKVMAIANSPVGPRQGPLHARPIAWSSVLTVGIAPTS